MELADAESLRRDMKSPYSPPWVVLFDEIIDASSAREFVGETADIPGPMHSQIRAIVDFIVTDLDWVDGPTTGEELLESAEYLRLRELCKELRELVSRRV